MALRIDDVDLQRDRMLVERFQEGDTTAFDTLYRRYFARLQRFCLKRVGDPHEAEEIAQEAFTRAYRALPALGGERRFYPWMTVIAGRLCVDHHRRRGRSEPAEVIDLGAVDGGQEAIVDRCDLGMLATAMDRLAPRHREVLEMRERRGMSYQQIAEHWDVPVGTVEALLFRARKALTREFLAIADGDRLGAWIALPVIGGLARKVALVKAKVAAWASALPPVVAPAALGVAVAVGSVAGLTVVGSGHDRQGLAAAPPVVRMVEAGAVGPAVDATAASGVVDTAGAGSAASARALPTPPVEQATIDAALPTNTRVGSAGATSAEAEDKPVAESITVGGERVLVGADPTTVVGELHNTIRNW